MYEIYLCRSYKYFVPSGRVTTLPAPENLIFIANLVVLSTAPEEWHLPEYLNYLISVIFDCRNLRKIVLIMKLNILDLLQVPDETLLAKNSTLAFYTGIAEMDIPLGKEFSVLYDNKYPAERINAMFKIAHIILLQNEANFIPKGYHAIIFVLCNNNQIAVDKLLDPDKRNFRHVCTLSDEG